MTEPAGSRVLAAALGGDGGALRGFIDGGGSPDTDCRLEARELERIGLGHHTGARAPLLVIAAGLGHAEIVSDLLEAGAEADRYAYFWAYPVVSANEQEKFRAGSALHAAARNGHTAIVELLLAAGARGVDRGDGYDLGEERTPLDAAKAGDHQEIIRLLEDAP